MKIIEKLRPVHEQRMRLLALGAGLPAVIAALALLWRADYTPRVQWPVTIAILFVWWTCASAIRQRVASPLRTLANLLEAMREGDYSIRGLGTGGEDALSEVMQQVNAMSATLIAQRLGALEATTLLVFGRSRQWLRGHSGIRGRIGHSRAALECAHHSARTIENVENDR